MRTIAPEYAYAKTIIPITGTTKTSVLITHQVGFESPRIRPFAPMTAVTKAESPLTREIVRANEPRLRHPNTSTGDKAITKKINGRIEGIIM
jgi:hypothetical protein